MKHIAVLQKEVIDGLAPQKNGNYIDLTLGYAGHAKLILEKTAPNGKLLGIDQDEEAIAEAKKVLVPYKNRVDIINENFTGIGLIIRKWKIDRVDGILLDLGPNTVQLKDEERGMSFEGRAPLDMRQDRFRLRTTAANIVNDYSEKDIREILQRGEEKFSGPIARHLVLKRRDGQIKTTDQLVELIKQVMPPSYRHKLTTHFATGTFRALRIEVNHELENLQHVLPQVVQILSPGGRIAIISFHSLEDRIVKNFFKSRDDLTVITDKPIVATDEEINNNPSARSAKLRVAEKIQ